MDSAADKPTVAASTRRGSTRLATLLSITPDSVEPSSSRLKRAASISDASAESDGSERGDGPAKRTAKRPRRAVAKRNASNCAGASTSVKRKAPESASAKTVAAKRRKTAEEVPTDSGGEESAASAEDDQEEEDQDDNEDEDEDDAELGLDHADSDGSDFAATRTHRVRAVGQRAAAAAAGPPSALATLERDLLYRICESLEPFDILRLARTCRPLRCPLMTRDAHAVWKYSRENTAFGPDLFIHPCPPNMSEPAWTALLFEKACCSCGRNIAKEVNFDLRRRYCGTCAKQRLMHEGKFAKLWPDYPAVLMELIPYTNVGAHSHGHATSSRFFWKDDIPALWGAYAPLTAAVHMRKPGARRQLDDFIDRARAQVADFQKSALEMAKWFSHFKSAITVSGRRLNGIRLRAVKEDFEATPVNELLAWTNDEVFTRAKTLTEKEWPTVKAHLAAKIAAKRVAQQERERENVSERRRQVALKIYLAHLKTIPQERWVSCPSLEDFLEFEDVRHARDAPNGPPEGDTALFAGIVTALAGLVDSWTTRRRAALRAIGEGPTPSTDDDDVIIVQDLSSIAFACTNKDCTTVTYSYPRQDIVYIGLEDALQHRCTRRAWTKGSVGFPIREAIPFQMRVHDRATSAVGDVISALRATLRLTVLEASPHRLDNLSPRLVCLHCPGRREHGIFGRLALTWRQAIAHYLEQPSHATPNWRVLSADEAKSTKARETTSEIQMWSCAHCVNEHLHESAQQATRPTIEKHLMDRHNVVDPEFGDDLYFLPWYHRSVAPSTKPVVFAMAPPNPPARAPANQPASRAQPAAAVHKYRCLQCANKSVAAACREFILGGVKSHLKDVHKMNQDNAKDGVHFILVSRSGAVAPASAAPPLAGRAGPGPSTGPAISVANANAAPPFNSGKGGSSTATQSASTTSAGALRPSQGAIAGASGALAFISANAGQASASSGAHTVRADPGASQQRNLGPTRQKPKDALRAIWVRPTSAAAHSAEIGKPVGMPRPLAPPPPPQVPAGDLQTVLHKEEGSGLQRFTHAHGSLPMRHPLPARPLMPY